MYPEHDLPSHLSHIPDRPVDLDEPCPDCGGGMIGMYEADTNAISYAECVNPDCGYTE